MSSVIVAAAIAEALEGRVLFQASGLPRFDHVVVVVEENHSYQQILTDDTVPRPLWAVTPPNPLLFDPFIRGLAAKGASLTNSHAITHPSYPNYLALFSGSTQGSTADVAPAQPFSGPDLGGELLAAGLTFGGYAESLPRPGYRGGDVGDFKRTHVPWVDFADVPADTDLPFGAFPGNLNKLPTVSFVVPNVANDMHSSSVRRGDRWLESNLHRYAGWAVAHNSLLIVTWDESSGSGSNQIPTIFFGAHVRHRQSAEPVNHYNVLRTIEDMYGLPAAGNSSDAAPITDMFTSSSPALSTPFGKQPI